MTYAGISSSPSVSTGAARAKRKTGLERQRALLRAWGRVELFTAQALAASLPLAPTLDEKMVLGEESLRHLRHFELLAGLYGETVGKPLLKDASYGVGTEPLPRDWFTVALAQWALLAASRASSDACLRAHDGAADEGPCVLETIACDLREQFELADAMLRDQLHRRGAHQETFEADAEQCLRAVLALMAGPSSALAPADAERAFLVTITTAFPSPEVRARFSETT